MFWLQLGQNLLVATVEVCVVFLAVMLLRRLTLRLLRLFWPGAFAEEAGAAAQTVRNTIRRLFLLIAIVAALAVMAIDAYWIYQGRDLLRYSFDVLTEISVETWLQMAQALGMVVVAILVARYASLFFHRGVELTVEKIKALGTLQANEESIERLRQGVLGVFDKGAILIVLAFSIQTFGASEAITGALWVVVRIYLILAAGLLIWRGLDVFVSTLEDLGEQLCERLGYADYYQRMKGLIPLARRCVEYVIYATVATLALLQIEDLVTLADWGPRIIRIIGAFFLARVVIALAELLIGEFFVERPKLGDAEQRRRVTLLPLLNGVFKYTVFFLVSLFALTQVGIDPMPILAATGILGLAVGYGAQNSIRDVIAGLFLLFENLFMVGDVITIGKVKGSVQKIGLRNVHICDIDMRTTHIIPNGGIGNVTLWSVESNCMYVDVGAAPNTNVDHLLKVIGRAAQEHSEAEAAQLTAPTKVMGLHAFSETELLIRTMVSGKPGAHIPMARALRKRIKDAFDAEGIGLPIRRVTLQREVDEGAAAA